MLCKVCGRTIQNEEANFCEYCGASFREGVDYTISGAQTFANEGMVARNPQTNTVQGNIYTNIKNTFSEAKAAANNIEEVEKPMTFVNWIIVLILPFIPVIGTIVYLAVLFSWAFGSNGQITRKNWARAMLVILVVAIIAVFSLFGGMEGVMNTFYGSAASNV